MMKRKVKDLEQDPESRGAGSASTTASGATASGATVAGTSGDSSRGQSKGYVLVAVVYLLGLCMGALDMSIVNPARTVIQNSLGVDDSLGVWILTIYTLAYAVSIPIMGKLADRHGRKYIYLLCIFLFGAGSALCGLANSMGSFGLLLGARVIQALGGGGIMPVATAEFGTAFPEEKRGMALGLVGMVYGLSSIFGPSVGSAILDVFGQSQWQFIFFVNIPVCLVVLILGLKKLPNSTAEEVKPIDGLGILLLTIMTLSLMYGLKNIDFFNFVASIKGTDAWPFLVIFVVLLPLFVIRENKAEDPVINLHYFRNVNILITLICAVISGIIMMGTIFFPQFCENALFMKSGSGGYFIALLGVGSGVGAMMSGKLIDKHGVKPVMALGFIGSAIGSLFMAFVACDNPTLINVCLMLILTGLGLGFTMGTPLNYMMLQNTHDSESNSALATLSLVRSIGTAVAPAIMVAFIVHASANMQTNLMSELPEEVTVNPLPYAQVIDQKMDEMRADEDTAAMLEGQDIPKLMSYTTIAVDMNNTSENSDVNVTISPAIIDEMQNSDVTTIVGVCKEMTTNVFEQLKPQLTQKASDGMTSGITAMEGGAADMQDGLNEMASGIEEMNAGLAGLGESIANVDSQISEASAKIDNFDAQITQMQTGSDKIENGIEQMEAALPGMKAQMATLTEGTPEWDELNGKIASVEENIPAMEAQKAELDQGIAGLSQARAGVSAGRDGMTEGRNKMLSAQSEMESGRSELMDAQANLQSAYDDLSETIAEMKAARDAIPAMFDEAETNYLTAVDNCASEIQATYQQTLNSGFKGMAIFVAICALVGLALLLPYNEKRRKLAEPFC